MPTLTLVRGVPGSGKSTLARTIVESREDTLHFEADMYFIRDGVYRYDKGVISAAYTWCFDATKNALSMGNDVVVSNTFTRIWEMEPYLNLARECGYTLNVIECKGHFGSIHNVPQGTVRRMRERWEEFPCQ